MNYYLDVPAMQGKPDVAPKVAQRMRALLVGVTDEGVQTRTNADGDVLVRNVATGALDVFTSDEIVHALIAGL